MSEGNVWNERIGVSKTIRENILLYLSAEGKGTENDVRNTIRMSRDEANQHLRFLEEHGFVEKEYVQMGSTAQYRLTAKGDEFVADIRWGEDG